MQPGADRREHPERQLRQAGPSFTIKIVRGDEREVYACSRYRVSGTGGNTTLIMTEHGTGMESTVSVKPGHRVYVVNAHGATVDAVNTQSQNPEPVGAQRG